MLFQDPPLPQTKSEPVMCPNTKKACENSAEFRAAILSLRSRMYTVVLLGAAVGAGVGGAAKDIIKAYFGL